MESISQNCQTYPYFWGKRSISNKRKRHKCWVLFLLFFFCEFSAYISWWITFFYSSVFDLVADGKVNIVINQAAELWNRGHSQRIVTKAGRRCLWRTHEPKGHLRPSPPLNPQLSCTHHDLPSVFP